MSFPFSRAFCLAAISAATVALLSSACSDDASAPTPTDADAASLPDSTAKDATTTDVAVADTSVADTAVDSATVTDATAEAAADAGSDASADADADASLTSYSATTDFSTASNPNGVWTYGYTTTFPAADAGDAGTLVVFSTNTNGAWFDPNNVNLGAPAVFRNDTGAAINGVAPGELSLHPGNLGEYTIVRWTAPRSGTFSVHVEFKDGDIGDTDGFLLHNGVTLVTEASTSTAGTHDRTVTVALGDRLDLAVGPKGSFLYDSTPVVFTVTP